MHFRIGKVVLQAFPDDGWVEQGLADFGLSQHDIVDGLTGYQTSAALNEDLGHQQVLAKELEEHLRVALMAKGLVKGRDHYSPRLGERPDLVLCRDGRVPQLYVEIEFRPNVEKDLVKFQIGANTGLLGLAILILAVKRQDINAAYTTMPEFAKYLEVIRELRPSYPLLLVGISGSYVHQAPGSGRTPAGSTSPPSRRSSAGDHPQTPTKRTAGPRREPELNGRSLNREWKVGAAQALYHRDGAWYHRLERFPGAFFDPNGYVLFRTREEYERTPYLSIGKHVNVRSGISSMPTYVRIRKETDA